MVSFLGRPAVGWSAHSILLRSWIGLVDGDEQIRMRDELSVFKVV